MTTITPARASASVDCSTDNHIDMAIAQAAIDGLQPGALAIHRPTGAGPQEAKSIAMSEKQNGGDPTAVVDDVFTTDDFNKGNLLPPNIQALRNELRAEGNLDGLKALDEMILAKAKEHADAGVPVCTPTTATKTLSITQLEAAYASATHEEKVALFQQIFADADLSGLSIGDAEQLREGLQNPDLSPADAILAVLNNHGVNDPNFNPDSLGQPGDKGLRDLYDLHVGAVFFAGLYGKQAPAQETYYKLKGQDVWVPASAYEGDYSDLEREKTISYAVEVPEASTGDILTQTAEAVFFPPALFRDHDKHGTRTHWVDYPSSVVSKTDVKRDLNGNVVMTDYSAYDNEAVDGLLRSLLDKVPEPELI